MTAYCKWCDTLLGDNEVITVFKTNPRRLIWVGCYPCFKDRMELKNND